ncbi:MAG: hypothetical protein M3Q64_00865 [bacterium]|nr:hypothetical protein [bacterium]
MDKSANLALVLQMIEAAEKNIQSAKQLLREGGGPSSSRGVNSAIADRMAGLGVSEGGKVIEGVFDGQNMIGPDNKQYPVPANYASKSKLVEGDVLKLTIADDGSFIYKQIGPVERRKVIGVLLQDEKGDYKVIAEGKTFKVLLASLTYFKAEAGDEVTIVVPEDGDPQWAAVEHVIKKGAARGADAEIGDDMSPDDDVEARDMDAEMEVEAQPAPEDEEF